MRDARVSESPWGLDALLDHVAHVQYDVLRASVKDAAQRVLLDTLGVIVGARKQPIAEKLAEYLGRSSQKGESTALTTSWKVDSATAAFTNGSISHDLELDDIHQGTSMHVAAVLVPAALATGEEADASAEDLFLALIRGYEITCRVGRSLDHEKLFAAGFHPSTVCGVIGAAAVAASLLTVSDAMFRRAIHLAMALSCGTMACKSEPDHYAKSFQIGLAARNGVIAAQLAARETELGRDGSSEIFTGTGAAYTGAMPGLDALTDRLGEVYEIALTSYKIHPCCRCIHPLLDALHNIRREAEIEAAAVNSMELILYKRGAISVDDHALRTHNARYVMAMALQHGVLRRDMFTAQASMATVASLMTRIRLVGDEGLQKEWPEKYPGIVNIETRDGKHYSERVDYPRGTPENPVATDDLRKKFLVLTGPVIGVERSRAAADLLLSGDFRLRRLMSVLTQ